MATRHDTFNCVDTLLLILLAWRNTIKGNLGCSTAKLVFGTPQSLPRQYVDDSSKMCLAPTTPFVQELRFKMAQLKYTPPQQQETNSYIPQRLCVHFHLERRRVTITLTQQVSFKDLRHSNKHLTIKRCNSTDAIALDQTKPASLEREHSTASSPQTLVNTPTSSLIQQTRPDRRVIFPNNLRKDSGFLLIWSII